MRIERCKKQVKRYNIGSMPTEAETRKKLIDTKLSSAGWDVNDCAQVSQEFDISVPLPEGVSEPRTQMEYCYCKANWVSLCTGNYLRKKR